MKALGIISTTFIALISLSAAAQAQIAAEDGGVIEQRMELRRSTGIASSIGGEKNTVGLQVMRGEITAKKGGIVRQDLKSIDSTIGVSSIGGRGNAVGIQVMDGRE